MAPSKITTQERIRRFWSRIDQTNPGGCWLWTAGGDRYGLYYFQLPRDEEPRMHGAHRIAYFLAHGTIDPSLQVHHAAICVSTFCCNPAHLSQVTAEVHANELTPGSLGYVNSRKIHCPHGHAYDEANTRHKNGQRVCKACEREYKTRKREEARVA